MAHTSEENGPRVLEMSEYERQVWDTLNRHWERRNHRKALPSWASTALERTGDVAETVGKKVVDALPEMVEQPMRTASDFVADRALQPTVDAVVSLLELVNDWALELNDPKAVEALARKQGLGISSFLDLRGGDLKTCDRLLTNNTLRWRTIGAAEGGAMGMLAMVPVAGIPVALTADVLVTQVMSVAIAARVAYSYGYDAKDPNEAQLIERLVRRSFLTQAAKAKPLGDAAKAANAIKDRVKWSEKLRTDHRLLAVLEKLMQQLGPKGSTVSVKQVAKVVPVIGILIGAGTNAAILGSVADDARRYCQTRFLSEKYALPLPTSLATAGDDETEA